MFRKVSKAYAILGMKCPRCHEGDLFLKKNPYDLKNMSKMHDRCPVCDQNYNPEPNLSYAYTVALFVAVYVISSVFLGFGTWTTVAILSILLVFLSPFLFRLSRSTYINMIIGYRPNIKKNTKND